MIFGAYLKPAFVAAMMAGSAHAIDLNIGDEQSIKNAAGIAVFNTMTHYTSNQTGQIPGKFSPLWKGGALFDIMIQYWYLTGDASNNPAVSQAMYHQRGDDNDYLHRNWSMTMYSEDQVAWGLAAMTAAELDYPQDPSMPSWLTLAEGVFHSQITTRWDTGSCNGGLRRAKYVHLRNGYNVKNAFANGGLFQLAARLAKYTNGQQYIDWAEKIWDWSVASSLLDTRDWKIGDLTMTDSDCKPSYSAWTNNFGPYISGAAYMYNVTNGENVKWKVGLDSLLNTALRTFFRNDGVSTYGTIMYEFACEYRRTCTPNQDAFKGLFAADLAFVTVVAPYTKPEIIPRLQGSAVGAAKQCTGGSNGTLCCRSWTRSQWDGSANMEEQMSATSIFTSNLVVYKDPVLATCATNGNCHDKSNGDDAPHSGILGHIVQFVADLFWLGCVGKLNCIVPTSIFSVQ